MDQETKNTVSETEIDFQEAVATSTDGVVSPEVGDKLKGKILKIEGDTVLIDCGATADAVMDVRELDGHQAGDEVDVVVTETEPSLLVTRKVIANKSTLDDLQRAFDNQLAVTGKITNAVKGGFEVSVAGQKAFLPVSQLDVTYVENTSDYIGRTFEFRISEFDANKGKFVVSRAALIKELKAKEAEETWAKIEPGAILQGEVRSIQDFGAFVDLGGVDGLVHISELSQAYTNHPSEVLKIGQQVKVKVIRADRSNNRIGLSMKELAPDPWEEYAEQHKAGEAFSGKIVRKADFGLFVELASGVDGLLHVSQLLPDTELSDERYAVGQTLEGWIRLIDPENKRVSLTLRQEATSDVWDKLQESFKIDDVIEGTIEEATKYGVFVELRPGITGLMPLSELKKLGFRNIEKDFPPESKVKVQITAIDSERKRISLVPHDVAPAEAAPAAAQDGRRRSKKKKRVRPEEAPRRSHSESQGGMTEFGALLAAALKAKNK